MSLYIKLLINRGWGLGLQLALIGSSLRLLKDYKVREAQAHLNRDGSQAVIVNFWANCLVLVVDKLVPVEARLNK